MNIIDYLRGFAILLGWIRPTVILDSRRPRKQVLSLRLRPGSRSLRVR